MLVKGLPNGDTKMIVVLDKKDTTLAGVIQDSVGTEISKFSKVELRENGVTVYFTAQGYDVYMMMNKKDEDHITGSMMDMFDAEGMRSKQPNNHVYTFFTKRICYRVLIPNNK